MEGIRLDTEALISPDIEEPMIGVEWMKVHRCQWDFQESQLYIDGQAAGMLTQPKKLRCRRLYVDQEIVVSALYIHDVRRVSTTDSKYRLYVKPTDDFGLYFYFRFVLGISRHVVIFIMRQLHMTGISSAIHAKLTAQGISTSATAAYTSQFIPGE